MVSLRICWYLEPIQLYGESLNTKYKPPADFLHQRNSIVEEIPLVGLTTYLLFPSETEEFSVPLNSKSGPVFFDLRFL